MQVMPFLGRGDLESLGGSGGGGWVCGGCVVVGGGGEGVGYFFLI